MILIAIYDVYAVVKQIYQTTSLNPPDYDRIREDIKENVV